MQRPVVLLCAAMLLLFACDAAEDEAEHSDHSAQMEDQQSTDSGGLTLTPEGRERSAGESEELPMIDPRVDAFERGRGRATALFPLDYYIGAIRPPRNAFDRQIWELGHRLLEGSEENSITVASFDRDALEEVRRYTGGDRAFRLTPPVSLGDEHYSLLFRRTGSVPVSGEVILVLNRGQWYTAGIQWVPVDPERAPYAPGQSIPKLVW